MAKKGKEISLDDLEEELAEELEDVKEEEEEKDREVEEIEEFSLDDISEEEEISEIFEEGIEGREEVEEIEEPEEEIIDERIYVVPLAKARHGPRNKYAKKAIRYLREFMTRHFKPESLVISQEVNEKIWERGIQKLRM